MLEPAVEQQELGFQLQPTLVACLTMIGGGVFSLGLGSFKKRTTCLYVKDFKAKFQIQLRPMNSDIAE